MNEWFPAPAWTRTRLTWLLATVSIVAVSTSAGAGSLADSVSAALASNPELGVVQADRLAVDQELRQARAGYLPSVDARVAAGPEYTDDEGTRNRPTDGDGSISLFRREAQLSLSQMLFDGFATQSEVARQRARVDSAAYRVSETSEFVALDAIEAHLDVLRNIEILALNEGNVEQHRKYLSQVIQLERGGRTDIADVRQAESRLARTEENLAVAIGNLADARAAYIRVVGAPPEALDNDDKLPMALPATADAAADLASTNSPTVRIAAADVDVASAELRGSRAGFYPRFDIELGADAGEDIDGVEGNDVGASALVVMSYNLFRGGGDMAREREAFHRANRARADLANARRAASEEARISYNALDTAIARTVALTAKVEAQRRTRDAYVSQFDLGNRALLDVLDAENELFQDRVNLVTATVTEDFARYRVLAVVGELLDTFDIARPREQISIERTFDDLQTPEAIEEKSRKLIAPRAEPRLLAPEEGAPPLDDEDVAPHTGAPASRNGANWLGDNSDRRMAGVDHVEPVDDARMDDVIAVSTILPVGVERLSSRDLAAVPASLPAVQPDAEAAPALTFFDAIERLFGSSGKSVP